MMTVYPLKMVNTRIHVIPARKARRESFFFGKSPDKPE